MFFGENAHGSIHKIQEDQLSKFLEHADELCFEQDTLISGPIRILRFGDQYFVQETTDKGQIIIRKYDHLDQARQLVNERLDIYEKMWNGCGCKINYFQ